MKGVSEMEVDVPRLLVPKVAVFVHLNGQQVMLNPARRWPVFEVGARETRGIEHLLAPLDVDFAAPQPPAAKSKEKTQASEVKVGA